MDESHWIILLALVVGSTTGAHLYLPKDCSNFKKDVNLTIYPHIPFDLHNLHLPDFHNINFTNLLHAPSVGKRSESDGRRFIVSASFAEKIKTMFANIKAAYTSALPASKEIQSTCRVNLTTATTYEIDFLRALRNKYQLCYVCDGVNNQECQTIGICRNGTHCYHGYNPDYHSTNAAILNQGTSAFGCCDPKTDSHCSHMQTYHTKLQVPKMTANFTIAPCYGHVCTGDSKSGVYAALHKLFSGKLKPYKTEDKFLGTVSLNLVTLSYVEICVSQKQHENGGWTSWSHWSSCAPCDRNGHQLRSRRCTNPKPTYGGKTCIGSSTVSRSCHVPCHKPLNGGWSHWTSYSACSLSCCTGHKTRSRKCNSPTPAYGGAKCSGVSSQTTNCTNPCRGDAHWSVWANWSQCSKTCAGGSKTRSRTCLKQSTCTGQCPGAATYMTACNTKACPEWTVWSPVACSVTCGTGKRITVRHCNSGRDSDCFGSASKTESCKERECPVDGNWGAWYTWGHCSTTCGAGKKTRTRPCNNPTPANGGSTCPGDETETTSCQVKHCPRNGHWGTWSSYSACSVSCCEGHKTRTRKCDHPTPLYGGSTCPGMSKEIAKCDNPCKGDAHWSDWAKWSTCTVSCQNGTMTRTRTCANKSLCTGPCPGDASESSSCNLGKCPGWSSWFYGECSATCGQGTKQGMRRCSTGHEEDCSGKSFTTTTCQVQACPVNGNWGEWNSWGSCSTTCGDGTWSRKRVCDNPVPAHGGKTCVGIGEETGPCKTMDCPHWGQFYEAGSCSVTCGNGVIQLQRDCSTGNSKDCVGSAYDEKACEKVSCPA